jgi:predicted MFS family arabinose efflux permease
MEDRGAFMSINASLQQIAGGVAAAAAGMIVVQQSKYGPLEHYDIVGYVIIVISVCSILLMKRVSDLVNKKAKANPAVIKQDEVVISEGF